MEQLIHTLFKMHPTSSVLRIDLKLTSLAFLLHIVMDRCMHAVMARLCNRALKSRVFTLPVKELEAIFER